jgi:hypothetical protein
MQGHVPDARPSKWRSMRDNKKESIYSYFFVYSNKKDGNSIKSPQMRGTVIINQPTVWRIFQVTSIAGPRVRVTYGLCERACVPPSRGTR